LFQLTTSIDWSQKKPVVTREVIIGDDSWERGSLLLSVGQGENEIRLRGGRNADLMKKVLQEHIDADGSLWVGLRKHRVGWPWRWVLRCPCLVFSTTLLAVFALIGIGATSAPISLNTNFDSLMESDSAASLNYDAILQ
ncbi:PTCHD2, partial [Symbiodinium pilosum]